MILHTAWLLIYVCIEILNYLMTYKIVLEVKFKKQIWIYIVSMVILVLVKIMIFPKSNIDNYDFFAIYIIPLFWIQPFRIKWVVMAPIIFFGTSLFNIMGSFAYAFLFHKTQHQVSQSAFLTILSELTTPVCIFAYWKIKNTLNKKGYEISIKKPQIVILLAGTLCCSISIGANQILADGENLSQIYKQIYSGAITLVSIIFIVVIIWQVILIEKENQYKIMTKDYENYMQLQEEHIRLLTQKDEKQRRFRHDFHAHVQALKSYSQNREDAELKNYIENMEKDSVLYEVTSYTGIAAADAVISEQVALAVESGIDIQWEGRQIVHSNTDIYDICTIYFNLLKNAREACEKIEDGNEKTIRFCNSFYDNRYYIQIKNTFSPDTQNQFPKILETTKTDKQNHGFGIQSVKSTVKKYNGILQYKKEDKWIVAEVLL